MLSEFLLAEMNRLLTRDALPLHRQLYEALRRAMLDGKLAAGERLPSSRDLAQDLQLSRNTVVAAINQLSVEGYLASRVGSGTYVNDSVPRALPGQGGRRAGGPARASVPSGRLSARGVALSTTFCATEWQVGNCGLERHTNSECNHFVTAYFVVISNTALCRTASGVVMHSPSNKLVSCSIVASKWDSHFDDSSWRNDRLDQAIFQIQPLASLTNTKFGCFEC